MQFDLKRIKFLSRTVLIVCQNENGPCPLIALANTLLLQGRIFIHPDNSIISLTGLIELIANCLLEQNENRNKTDAESSANYLAVAQRQDQLNDVLTILPSLVHGLDLNICFDGVDKFEFTRELTVFDALGISVFHGWVVDPDDEVTAAAVFGLSYNQLVNKVVEAKASLDITSSDFSETKTELISTNENDYDMSSSTAIQLGLNAGSNEVANTIEDFLNATASQLTITGLKKLHEMITENQLAVFFRNNHFATIFCHEAQLYLLVTDSGYLRLPLVTWERLDTIAGSSEFVDEDFLISAGETFSTENDQTLQIPSSSIITNRNTINPVKDDAADEIRSMQLELKELMRQTEAGETVDSARLSYLLDAVTLDDDRDATGRENHRKNGEKGGETGYLLHDENNTKLIYSDSESKEDEDLKLARLLQKEEEERASQQLLWEIQQQTAIENSRAENNQAGQPSIWPSTGPVNTQTTSSNNNSSCIIS